MTSSPFQPYDGAAFEEFCGGLVDAGFSPIEHTGRTRWNGPVRPSLVPLTQADRMDIEFRDGWPLRYPQIRVADLSGPHASGGYICLWADDDPAQVAAQDIDVLWARVDEWAAAAEDGFRVEDQTLDGYMNFENRNYYTAELPIVDLLNGTSNGAIVPLQGRKRGKAILINEDGDDPKPLKGVLYVRNNIGQARTTLDDVIAALTGKQRADIARGLSGRADVALNEGSGGYDFVAVAWPRYGKTHELLVVGFAGAGETLRASAYNPSPSDKKSRALRAGLDHTLLQDKNVLVVGAGSIGGQVALTLGCAGVGNLTISDSDILKTTNLVRHVASKYLVGYKKSLAVALEVDDQAPWCKAVYRESLPLDPTKLADAIEGFNLVVDCTGNFALTAALAQVCHDTGTAFVTGALFHQGNLLRVRRQATGDTPIAERRGSTRYLPLPPQPEDHATEGFLEVGCIARVNNASPVAVQTAAATVALVAVDYLTSRLLFPDEQITVLAPCGEPPFDTAGAVTMGEQG